MPEITAERRQKAAEELHTSVKNGESRLLTLDYLEQNELSVYVRNNTNVGSYMVIDIPVEGGRPQTLEVQNTDVPYDLTARWTHKQLRASQGLRKSLQNRTLILVDPIEAEAFLARPEVQGRVRKALTSKFSKDTTAIAPSGFSVKPKVDVNIVPGAPDQVSVDANVSGRLRAMTGEFKAGNVSEDDFADDVANNARTFSERDWQWLGNECRDSAQITAMCQQQLSVPKD